MNHVLIPTPHTLIDNNGRLSLNGGISIHLASQDQDDVWAANYLAECLDRDHKIRTNNSVQLGIPLHIKRKSGTAEGYSLKIEKDKITITGNDAAGVYYACQTLRQCVEGQTVPLLEIEDQPRMQYRAMHIDNKHHQTKFEYVQYYIREIAHYKANILVWEWEDKFAYPSHPQVGAPGAFTLEEMQELTAYARQHHIELVPLVQGLGHVSFILKHPAFRHIREVPDSDWEVCPLKEESYELLFELWKDAMDATPGSSFFHIGSDETYELGLGVACGCAAHAAEHGKDSLMRLFIDRCTQWVESQGRICLSWGGQWKANNKQQPLPSMIWTDGDNPAYIKQSIDAGYPCWIYAPNNDIPPLINNLLPWTKWCRTNDNLGGQIPGSFHHTSSTYTAAAEHPQMNGSICTSWEDSGLHNQMWILHHICACEYSWNPGSTDIDTWIDRLYKNYFGPQVYAMRECQHLLQCNAHFFDDTFERRVWHYGYVGRMHTPDFPREGLEFNPFFIKEYHSYIRDAKLHLQELDRADAILNKNIDQGAKHKHDLEIMLSCTALMRVNAKLILMMSEWETLLSDASLIYHHSDKKRALENLRSIEKLLQKHLTEKEQVYTDLVTLWEKTRLPKGYSTETKKYFYKRERARHLANKTPDMRYLVYDMDKLDIQGYLDRLTTYNDHYEQLEIRQAETQSTLAPSLSA